MKILQNNYISDDAIKARTRVNYCSFVTYLSSKARENIKKHILTIQLIQNWQNK